jgi:hypothetical protein
MSSRPVLTSSNSRRKAGEKKAAPQNPKADNKEELQRTVHALQNALKELRKQLNNQEAPPTGK